MTEPERFGPARNPWDTDTHDRRLLGRQRRAVASGMVPFGHANDGGGSIRIPASCCGLVGLKPSRGRVSMAPDFAELVGGIGIDGIVSHTVADTAPVLDIISGYETGDPYWAHPDPQSPVRRGVGRPPGTLRIAFTRRRRTARRWTASARPRDTRPPKLLESLGHSVEEAPAIRPTRATSRTSSRSGPPGSRMRCTRTAACAGHRWTSRSSSP